MLKLKSSARESNRYLLIRGGRDEVEKAILDYVGILGWAKAAPHFVKKQGNNYILAVSRKEIDKIRHKRKQIEENMKNYLPQIGRILDIEKCEVRYNSEWWGKIETGEFLKMFRNFKNNIKHCCLKGPLR